MPSQSFAYQREGLLLSSDVRKCSKMEVATLPDISSLFILKFGLQKIRKRKMEALPNEILHQIIQKLNLREVCALAMCCRNLSEAAGYTMTWYRLTNQHFLCREKFNKEVTSFIERLGKEHSWKTCFRLLFKIQNFRPAFFWDDAQEIDLTWWGAGKLKANHRPSTSEVAGNRRKRSFFAHTDSDSGQMPNDLLSCSEVAAQLVHSFLREGTLNKSEDGWRLTKEQVQRLCLLYGTIHSDFNLPKFIRVLLQIGMGPYDVGRDYCYCPLSTRTINRFYMLRYREELYRYKRLKDYRVRFEEECDSFLSDLKKTRFKSGWSEVFRSSKEDVQKAVLRVLVSILQHFELSISSLAKMSPFIEHCFKSYRWSSETASLRNWILNLLDIANQKKARYKEAEIDRKSIRKQLLDSNYDEHHVALRMTYQDQMNLTSYKLNEYIDSILLDKRRQDDEMYRALDLLEEEKLEVRRLLQLQEFSLPSYLVKYFEQSLIVNKTKKVQRLIDISERLHELKNYFSLKNLMQAIRGILSTKSKTNMSWGDIGFQYMKKFVSLETSVKADNDYLEYRREMDDSQEFHRIPLLVVHLREIQDELKRASEERDGSGEKNLPDGCWYYLEPKSTKKTLEMIGSLYHCFI